MTRFLTRESKVFNTQSYSDHTARLAALVTHALETGWAMYATWRGPSFQANFQEILASPGAPCSLNLFSAYWKTRQIYEV